MSKKIRVFLFAFIIFAIPIISLLTPYKTVSTEENRKLAAFPELSVNSIVSKKFMDGFANFVSDHIAFRDSWVTIKENIATLAGKRDNNGVYLCGDRLIGKVEEPKKGIYKRNIAAINDFAKTTGKKTYLLLAPTAAEIEKDKLPALAPTLDEDKFIKTVSKSLNGVTPIDITSALKPHKDEYIYYRTDHHWTTLGAFYAYCAASKTLGFEPLPESTFKKEEVTNSFNGTLYSKSGERSINPDKIKVYEPQDGFNLKSLTIADGGKQNIYNSILFNANLSGKNKYEVFFDGNKPYEDILTTKKDAKNLLIIKDSYAHAFVPFLMNHYSRITMLDMRYLTENVDKAVNINDYDEVLFLYNVDDFATDRTIASVS